MNYNTVAQQWELFEQFVVPKGAPDIQRREMRRAFYAGAEALLRMQHDIGDASVSMEAGVAMMDGWHEECRHFARDVKAGKA